MTALRRWALVLATLLITSNLVVVPSAQAVILVPDIPASTDATVTRDGYTMKNSSIAVSVTHSSKSHQARARCHPYAPGGSDWTAKGYVVAAGFMSTATCWGGYPTRGYVYDGRGNYVWSIAYVYR